MAYILTKMRDEDLSKMLDEITETMFQHYDYKELIEDILPQLIDRIDYYHTEIIDNNNRHIKDDSDSDDSDEDNI